MLKEYVAVIAVSAVLLSPVTWNVSAHGARKVNWQSALSRAKNYVSVLRRDLPRKLAAGAAVVLMSCGAFSCTATADDAQKKTLTSANEKILTDVSLSDSNDKLWELISAKGLDYAQISIDRDAEEIIIRIDMDGLAAEYLDRLLQPLTKPLEKIDEHELINQVDNEPYHSFSSDVYSIERVAIKDESVNAHQPRHSYCYC